MKKITEIILDKEAPLNLKSLWAEPQDDSTVALKVFNNGKWRSTSTKVDLSAYQTKTDESLQTVDKTIAGAINELNSNIGESGYNLIEYGVPTYDELVEMVGNGKPCFLNIEDNIVPVLLQDTRESSLGGISICPQLIMGENSSFSGTEVASITVSGFFIVTEDGWPSDEVKQSLTVMLNISNIVQDDRQLGGMYLMSAPSGTAVKNYVAEQLKDFNDIIYTSSEGSLLDWLSQKNPYITWFKTTPNGRPTFISTDSKQARRLRISISEDSVMFETHDIDLTTGSVSNQMNFEFLGAEKNWTTVIGPRRFIPSTNHINDYLRTNYQSKITLGTGLAFNGNTLNVTLDTNVFFVAESAPASPTDDQKKKICLVPADTTEEGNLYTEYVWIVDDEHPDGYWEEFGTYKSEVDLTPYLKIEDAADTYLSKTEASNTYQPKGEYQPAGDYALKSELPSYTAVPELTADYTVPANATTREFIYEIPVGATVYNITGASGIKWAGGTAPAVQANKTYLIRVIHNLATWTEF